MINLDELVAYLDDLLEVDRFSDYCPNGLQVEGRPVVRKLVSGVTASQALLQAARERQADAVLVHHGYFWRGEDARIVGMKRQRIQTLLQAEMSLLAYHLPLDAHPVYGNNAQLGERLGFIMEGQFGQGGPAIGLYGHLPQAMSATALSEQIERVLQRAPLHIAGGTHAIHSIAWCSGAAQGYIEQAVKLGVDAYLSGEISEQTVHIAREAGIHYFAAGHHATERFGVQVVGEHLAAHFGLEHEFVDIANPV
jgi:dinuclear metal center YbgI/SA1388 family protein